jgi:hypothetical protein
MPIQLEEYVALEVAETLGTIQEPVIDVNGPPVMAYPDQLDDAQPVA